MTTPIPQRFALIIDDDPINRRLASALFAKMGWQVADVSSGPAGLAWLDSHPCPDLILLDISMPEMSGIEVCQHLRQQKTYRNLVIIAYTAHAMPHERARFIEFGFTDILIKPITQHMLRDMVHQYLPIPH